MRLLIAEVVFALLLVAGVAFMFWPAALVLAGVLGVVACERASADVAAEQREKVRPIRRGEAA